MVRRIEGIDHWQQRLLASKRVEGDDQCLGRGLQLPRPIEEGPPQRTLARPVARYEQQTDYPRLVQRLKELSRKKLSSSEIAERLNAEGFRPPKRTDPFTSAMVLRLTGALGLARRPPHGSRVGLAEDEYRSTERARRLGLSRDLVRRWLRAGWRRVRRDAAGLHVLWADADERRRLQELHRLPRSWANQARLAERTKPKQRPAR